MKTGPDPEQSEVRRRDWMERARQVVTVIVCIWGVLFAVGLVIRGVDLIWDVPNGVVIGGGIVALMLGLIAGLAEAASLKPWSSRERHDVIYGWAAVALLIAAVAVILLVQEI